MVGAAQPDPGQARAAGSLTAETAVESVDPRTTSSGLNTTCRCSWCGSTALLTDAARLPALAAVVDADHPDFLPPGDMPARIAAACRRLGQAAPDSPAATVRCIVDSLALAHRAAIDDARRLSGRDVDVVHVVGGGARNELRCQLTADACGIPVEAGPVETTALGNVLVQARALGVVGDDLAGMRSLLRGTHEVRRYEPSGDQRRWAEAAVRASGH